MLVAFLGDFPSLRYLLASPLALVLAALQIWMLVDAARRREWLWFIFAPVSSDWDLLVSPDRFLGGRFGHGRI